MFFAVSKVLWFVCQPSSLMLLAVLTGIVKLMRGRLKSGRRWAVGGIAALLIGGILPVADLAYAPLESRFTRADVSKGDIAGIIVLGGAEDGRNSSNRELMALSDASERLTEAVALAHRFPKARLVFSGGSDAVLSHKEPEARIAGRLFEALGIDPARVTTEDKSRNTAENARFSKDLVQPKAGERWLLVTSAWHMPRAVGCFRAAGFPVEAWPVDYRAATYIDASKLYASFPEGLHQLDFAVKEYVGLVIYRLTGRIDALIPGPN